MDWFLAALKKYAVFGGRARRKEYWMFYLFVVICEVIAFILSTFTKAGVVLYIIISLAIILPSLSVLVRRLHDLGKSGAWFFISFIPFIGSIWLLILTCTEGTKGANAYGEDPKAIS